MAATDQLVVPRHQLQVLLSTVNCHDPWADLISHPHQEWSPQIPNKLLSTRVLIHRHLPGIWKHVIETLRHAELHTSLGHPGVITLVLLVPSYNHTSEPTLLVVHNLTHPELRRRHGEAHIPQQLLVQPLGVLGDKLFPQFLLLLHVPCGRCSLKILLEREALISRPHQLLDIACKLKVFTSDSTLKGLLELGEGGLLFGVPLLSQLLIQRRKHEGSLLFVQSPRDHSGQLVLFGIDGVRERILQPVDRLFAQALQASPLLVELALQHLLHSLQVAVPVEGLEPITRLGSPLVVLCAHRSPQVPLILLDRVPVVQLLQHASLLDVEVQLLLQPASINGHILTSLDTLGTLSAPSFWAAAKPFNL
mmetsp:Transcript_36489/g.56997  ORF Transcript_36489/g.56997 Transcript_36489/m.56997 type:complete len:364 (-) Transcript_36489:381-1472(-)